jgi:hypothetical protein
MQEVRHSAKKQTLFFVTPTQFLQRNKINNKNRQVFLVNT